MKAWRRSGGLGTVTNCGVQPEEVTLGDLGGGLVLVEWLWGVEVVAGTLEFSVNGGAWALESAAVNLPDGQVGVQVQAVENDEVQARLRVTGTAEACARLSNIITMGP